MQIPLILITYGFSRKLCTWEEDGIHKLPLFGEPVLAALFVKSFKKHMQHLLDDKDELQIQVCSEARHALDMFRIIGTIAPEAVVIYNAAPIGENPHDAIQEVSGQFQDLATVVNKEYGLDEATEIIEDIVHSSDSGSSDISGT